MNNKKIFVGLGFLSVIAVLAYFLLFKKVDKKDNKTAEKVEEKIPDPTVSTATPTVSGTPTVNGTTTTTGGGKTGTTSTTPIIYDPESEGAKEMIRRRSAQIANNANLIKLLKEVNAIGDNLFDGVSTEAWHSHGVSVSPFSSVNNFLVSIGGGKYVRGDFRTYPVYPSVQKGGIKGDFGKLAYDNWVSRDEGTADAKPFNDYNLATLSGANVLSHFGDHDRKHSLHAVNNAKTFSKNYIKSVEDLDEILEQAAYDSLKIDDNIYFTGINT